MPRNFQGGALVVASLAAALNDQMQARVPALLEDLEELVKHESPTRDAARIDALAGVLAARAVALGAAVTSHPDPRVGQHLEMRWNSDADGKPALVLCHMDTVHPVGMLQRNPWRVTDGQAWGPGTQDMKAGIVMTLRAVEALADLAIALPRDVVVLITADEETGSETSRGLIESLAAESAYALVLEGAAEGGAVKTARKGTGMYRLEVTGKAAHAGVAFERGINANVELARLVGEIAALTDLDAGTTVNVGVMGGGTVCNVVAEQAGAEIDLRFWEPAEAERIDAALHALSVRDGAALQVSGGINRPPMLRSVGAVALYERAQALAADLGIDLVETSVGGASDGNFTAALGVPTLDGLGADGAGLHTAHEWIDVASLPVRTALLAGLLATL